MTDRTRRRFMRFAALGAMLAPIAASASASPPAPKEHDEPTSADDREVARSVELAGLVFPVFDERRQLQNYLFVNARMLVATGKDPWKYREKSHFIRDALVRAAHRQSLNASGDYTTLNEELAAATCLEVANEVVGEPDALVSMTFTQIASQSRD
ncbi:MAG: hypothetical protein R3C52_12225 [Hyphomonadaceae bacterium]